MWSVDQNHPVRFNASLQLTQDENLILVYADRTSIWPTNTARKAVSALNLAENGNFMLLD